MLSGENRAMKPRRESKRLQVWWSCKGRRGFLEGKEHTCSSMVQGCETAEKGAKSRTNDKDSVIPRACQTRNHLPLGEFPLDELVRHRSVLMGQGVKQDR